MLLHHPTCFHDPVALNRHHGINKSGGRSRDRLTEMAAMKHQPAAENLPLQTDSCRAWCAPAAPSSVTRWEE